MTPFDLLLGTLLVWRLTRLFTADSITEPFRDRLADWVGAADTAAQGSRRAWAAELVTCPWCLSVWVAAATYTAWEWTVGDATWWTAAGAVAGWSALTGWMEARL